MAYFEMLKDNGFWESMNGLLQYDMREVAEEAMEEAGEIVKEKLVAECRKYKRTGDLADSIKADRKVGVTRDGGYIMLVRPTGKSYDLGVEGKTYGRNPPVRNAEKLAYHEYGTATQAKIPIIENAVRAAKPAVTELFQRKYEEAVDKTKRGST
jgi:HK97 gp10 family phage protein